MDGKPRNQFVTQVKHLDSTFLKIKVDPSYFPNQQAFEKFKKFMDRLEGHIPTKKRTK